MDEKLLKDISRNMEEKSTEELFGILKENNKEEWSEEAFESMRRILVSRGENLPEQPSQKPVAKGLAEGSELRGVVFAGGISRKTLNIMAVIGLFIFGWLITIAFDLLGKGKQGWMYFKALIATLMISKFFVPPVGWLALVIYITACIHANLLLSRYKKLATERLVELGTQGENNINVELEKGLILCRVLKDKKGVDVLGRTLQTAGGDASLLNLAGVVMSDNKRYKEAVEFFDRALAGTDNEVLIKQLKQNCAHADKKMAKYLKGERMKSIILLLTIVSLVLAVGSARNAESQNVTIRSRGSKVTANRLWQCPKCGTILEKRGLGKVWDPGDPITRVAGNATCGNCMSRYDQADVYGGMYDAEEKAKQEELPGFDGTVSMITYQLLSATPTNNSEAICENLLKKKYPKAKLGEFYCIGRADDNLTPDEGLVQYKEYVRNGTIPDIGTQFGTLQGNDITGKKVVVLFFKK